MGHSVVGVFRHSGDADLVAAHLRDAFTLDEDELDIIDETEPGGGWSTSASADDLALMGDADPVLKRWGDMAAEGRTVVVARSDDPDRAVEMAGEMRRAGAERVDLLPH